MKELMNYIYDTLSTYGATYFEDIDRDEHGVASIDDINIVYAIDGMYQLTDIEVKKDIPIQIDIWSKTEQIFDVEDLVIDIDRELSNEVYRSDTLIFMFKKEKNWTQNIRDEDSSIRRKRMNYIIKFYKKL